jgi:hypothetical protein
VKVSHLNSKLAFPPYGFMHDSYRWDMQLTAVPDNFRIDGRVATADEYTKYIDDEAKEMGDFLWPRYDFSRHAWVGGAVAHAEELTDADLTLMARLHEKLAEEVVVGSHRLGRSQLELFRLEDLSARGTLDLYLSALKESAPEVLEGVRRAVDAGFLRLGNTTLHFKQRFQRPRAYQVSFLLGRPFRYEYGAVAITPALVSGHCMQGLFVRAYAAMVQRRGLEEHLGALDAMRQYCIEIGDRRVYAGVHYPSDNLSSWYSTLRMCHHSFEGFAQEAKDFVWRAIEGSAVYEAIQQASAGPSPVYRPLLKRLQDEAARKA